ncbi:MAG: hypothetical protein D6689_04205, partial [Deltaproteobacteria bacterium]
MVAVTNRRAVTVPEGPSVVPRMFWKLAGGRPNPDDPVEVALRAIAALEALERVDRPGVTASTLTFLMRLDGDRVYAAPEQLRGEPTSQRSLVFTVGVVVFETLTGCHPFGATGRSARAGGEAARCVPPELRAVLETAMAPFAADRWSSLRALRDELARFVGRQRTAIAPAPRPRSVPPPCPGSAVRRVAAGTVPPAAGAPAARARDA